MKNCTSKWSGNDKGFTILELLISLTLISLIFVFLSGGFQFGRRIWETTQDIQESASVGPVQNFLHDTLSRARPVFVTAAQSNGVISFSGDQRHIRFVVNHPGHLTVGGLYVMEVFAEKEATVGANGSFVSLVSRQFLFRHNAADKKLVSDKSPPRKLIEHVKKIGFRYFGASKTGEARTWHDMWQGHMVLPDLVSIKIEFPNGDPRQWPEMLVELKLAAH